MKKHIYIRTFFGLMIIALGGVLLANNLGVINVTDWSKFWGVFWGGLLIISGLSALFSRRAWIWGILLAVVGTSIILGAFGVVDVNIWKMIWPAVLIGIGLNVLFKFDSSRRNKLGDTSREKVAVFYGEESRPKGDYDGGNLSAVFGGVDLDLRQAKIKDGAVIDVFTFCGGINITVPSDVIVRNEVRGYFGGSEDKTVSDAKAKKTIIVRGECVLGGLEIK